LNLCREQFEQMAAMLETDTLTLSRLIASMTKEERFRKMKQFYLKQYPQTKHFYESFGKAKRNASQMYSDESLLVEAKKAKTEIVETQKETNIDYYENLTTFENVLDLFESSPSKQSNDDLEEKQEEEQQQQGDWTDRILEIFKKNGNFENVLDATHSNRKQSKVFWPRRSSEKLLACSSKQATEAHNEQEEEIILNRNTNEDPSIKAMSTHRSMEKLDLDEKKISNNSITPKLTKKQSKLPYYLSDPSYLDKLLSP
jgi:adenylate kinase family enzyme